MANPDDYILHLSSGIGIRRYRLTDGPKISVEGNNRNIWNNLRNRMPSPYTEAAALEWITRCRDPSHWIASGTWTLENGGGGGASGPPIPTNYAITLHDEPIGAIGMEFNDLRDVYLHVAEVGYWLGEAHWGKGIMVQVVPAFVEWAWRTWGVLYRIEGSTAEWNVASGKLLQKAGMVFEGRRPMRITKNGQVAAELMWGAVRDGEGVVETIR